MSLLLFIDAGGRRRGWLRVDADGVAARGEGVPELDRDERVVAVAPGETVALHWLDLPAGLAPAQAAAAARLNAAELLAEPAAALHVAVGAGEGGRRCAAFVSMETMRLWLDSLAAEGIEPRAVVPEPLLIPAPESGIRRFGALHRGPERAFALEPELAALLVNGEAVETLEQEAFETGLAAAVERPVVDLLQGPFGPRRGVRIDRRRARRMAAWAAIGLLLLLVAEVVAILRYTWAADRAETETARIVASAVPGGGEGLANLDRRLAELRGPGAGFSITAAAVFEALRTTPNVELAAFSLQGDGSTRIELRGDQPAAIEDVARRLEDDRWAVESSGPRSAGGRQAAMLTVRAR